MNPEIGVFGQKFAHCDRFEGSFLIILGVKKNRSGLFRSFFRVFLEVFGHFVRIKRPSFVY